MPVDSPIPKRLGIFGGYGHQAKLAPSKMIVVLNANQSLVNATETFIGNPTLWTVQENLGGWSVNSDGSLAAPSGLTHISAVGHITFANDGTGTGQRQAEIRVVGAWSTNEAASLGVRWETTHVLTTTGRPRHLLHAPIIAIPDPYPAIGIHLRAWQNSGGNLNVIPSDGTNHNGGTWLNVTGYYLPELG